MGQSIYKADAPAASYMDVTAVFADCAVCTMLPHMRARWISVTGVPRLQAAQRSPSASQQEQTCSLQGRC